MTIGKLQGEKSYGLLRQNDTSPNDKLRLSGAVIYHKNTMPRLHAALVLLLNSALNPNNKF